MMEAGPSGGTWWGCRLKNSGGDPAMLREMADMFSLMDRSERIQALIDLGTKFKPVPAEIASQPYPATTRVPHCESDAYVFAEPLDDGTLKFHFDVLNPQGISARATAVILDKALSGAPLDEIAKVDPDVIYDIFGRELSMGKNMGLTGMINMCKLAAARQRV